MAIVYNNEGLEMMQIVLFFQYCTYVVCCCYLYNWGQTLSCIYHFFILNLRRVLSELGHFFYWNYTLYNYKECPASLCSVLLLSWFCCVHIMYGWVCLHVCHVCRVITCNLVLRPLFIHWICMHHILGCMNWQILVFQSLRIFDYFRTCWWDICSRSVKAQHSHNI